MPKTEAQVVPREVQDALDIVTQDFLDILGAAGVNVTAPNSKENRAKFLAELKDKKIEFRKVISGDRPDMNGTAIMQGAIQIGFIPTLGVVGGGRKIIV